METQIYKNWSEILVTLCTLPRNLTVQKTLKTVVRFRTASPRDREYLWNATKHYQSENVVANYGHSRSRTGKFGVLWSTNGKN